MVGLSGCSWHSVAIGEVLEITVNKERVCIFGPIIIEHGKY